MLRQKEIYTARIEDYTAEGQGVCRVEGCAVFVPDAIFGELCRIRITKAAKTWAAGEIVQILEVSPHRVNRACPQGKRCGGCAFPHMDYEEECRLKSRRVTDALNRLAGEQLSSVPILPAPAMESYRNKAQYPVVTERNRALAGFYQAGTHRVIPIQRCGILPPEMDQIRKIVTDYMDYYRVNAYDESTGKGLIRHIYVRKGWVSGQILVCLVTTSPRIPHESELIAHLQAAPGFATLVLSVNRQRGNSVLGQEFRTLYGPGWIADTLCGLEFRLSPRSFYQVNHDQAERLYRLAIDAAGITGRDTVLDLYCGVGTITLAMAKEAGRVIGVELEPQAVADAQDNARRNGMDNVEFLCADAGKAAQELEARGIRPDVVVVDPPRKGLSEDVVAAVSAMSPQRLVYVSCDPATLARDVARFKARGYQLQSAQAVDMFPRCAHVETIVCLTKEADKMISDERSKYKSWSNLKKQMSDLICDSLRDKISYFYTSYHEVHNAYGRATINYCKKEVAAFSWVEQYAQERDIIDQYKKLENVPSAIVDFEGSMRAYKIVNATITEEKWMPNCTLCETDFINAITIYLKTDIAISLQSDNYLLRVFAYMDRRIGKRTLVKIKDEVEKLPEWVKQFYQIRCEADGIVF